MATQCTEEIKKDAVRYWKESMPSCAIETFHNTVRIRSHCGYLSPKEYEENYRKEL